jgi:ribose-phosphate pyrophosphokinase
VYKQRKAVLLTYPNGEINEFAKRVMAHLNTSDCYIEFAEIEVGRFACGELCPSIPIKHEIRGRTVYFLPDMFHPDPHTAFFKMLLTADAMHRGSVGRIVLVLPYIPYMRQDRTDWEKRVPVSAKVIGNLIRTNKSIKRIMTIELHTDQAESFFSHPTDNLPGMNILAERVHSNIIDHPNIFILAPDAGSVKRAERFSEQFNTPPPTTVIHKNRKKRGVEIRHFIEEDLTGRNVIIFDDMIDTGGTIVAAAKAAYTRGAKSVSAYVTHGIFSQDPRQEESTEHRLKNAGLRVFVTESILRDSKYKKEHSSWLTIIPTDKYLGEAIHRSIAGSVSKFVNSFVGSF